MAWDTPMSGAGFIDYEFFMWCRTGGQDKLDIYDTLSATRDRYIDEAKDAYMAAGGCAEPPLLYRNELIIQGENAQHQHRKLQELKAPKAIVQSRADVIQACIDSLSAQKYAEAHDGAVEYRVRYDARKQDWWDSDDLMRVSAKAFFEFLVGARETGFTHDGTPIPTTLTETRKLLERDEEFEESGLSKLD